MRPHFPLPSAEELSRLDVVGPRYTSYPTVPEWTDRYGEAEHRQALARAAVRADEPLSLYVHLPFCREMCRYCGCNVIVTKDSRRADAYLDVLDAELGLLAGALGDRRLLSRVHLGGGTPTFLTPAQLERLWASISARFRATGDAELAVEVDPMVTTPAHLETLRALGFTRLSMGVQDLDPAVQEAVNRIQPIEVTAETIALARRLGFTSVNVDMIYGLPRQTAASWTRTMQGILSLAPDRAAVYSFAFVPAQKPHQRLLPVADIPGGRAKLELLAIAHDAFVDAGYEPIGIDHFARPEDELAVARVEGRLWRDFQGYTVKRAADTVAAGVTSISGTRDAYAQATRSLADHARAVGEGRLPIVRGMALSDDDRRRRDVIVELMCNGTVDLSADAERFASELARLAAADDGLAIVRGARVELTPLGRVFARNVAMVFDAYAAGHAGDTRPAFSRTV